MTRTPVYEPPTPVTQADGSTIIYDWGTQNFRPYTAEDAARRAEVTAATSAPRYLPESEMYVGGNPAPPPASSASAPSGPKSDPTAGFTEAKRKPRPGTKATGPQGFGASLLSTRLPTESLFR